jgi:phage shock protein PspC (stress-responsive transcriptional regulator)
MAEKTRIILGVSYWIAQKLNLDPTVVRIGFIALTVVGGSGIMLYLFLWLLKIISED